MSTKKESFVKGTLILAAAALVARVLGLAQRVPLEHLFNTTGNASFTIANNVYLLLLPLATAGIPSTLSKMVSERYALNRPHEAQQVYRAALIFAAIVGVLMSVALYIAAPYYAEYSKVPESTLAIRAIAPALLLFPAIAMMRGYFQGRNNMMAGGAFHRLSSRLPGYPRPFCLRSFCCARDTVTPGWRQVHPSAVCSAVSAPSA
ncbi:oligosaccharide flippase family protein [Paenibacillus rhizoplanae]